MKASGVGRLSRRSLLGLGLVLPTCLMSACARPDAAQPGWDRVLVDGVSLLVRNDWTHGPAPEALGSFHEQWYVDGDNGCLVAVGASSETDMSAALEEGTTDLRSFLPGFEVVTDTVTLERSGTGIAYLDVRSRSTQYPAGRLWVLSGVGECVAVFMGYGAGGHADRETVQGSLMLVVSPEAPSLPTAWRRVGRGATTLGVPRSWTVCGALAGSGRWSETWADADLDGYARALVLLCPDLGKTSANDALAQLESDASQGAIPGYKRLREPEPFTLRAGGGSGVKVSFDYRNTVTRTPAPVSTATVEATPVPNVTPSGTAEAPGSVEPVEVPGQQGTELPSEGGRSSPSARPGGRASGEPVVTGKGTGVLWLIEQRDQSGAVVRVSAVQATFVDGADTSIVGDLEASLWLVKES